MDYNKDYPTDDYLLKFNINTIRYICGCSVIEYDDYSVVRMFSAYFPYPFIITDVRYKRSKYQKRIIESQTDNLLFNFPKEVTYTILKLIPFSDMKAMALTCVSFYKLIAGRIGEMALRYRYLNNKIATHYDKMMCIYSEYPPDNCENNRYWWCKTKNILCLHRFKKRYEKDYPKFAGAKYENFATNLVFDRRKYLRGEEMKMPPIGIHTVIMHRGKNKKIIKKSDYIEKFMECLFGVFDDVSDEFIDAEVDCYGNEDCGYSCARDTW